MSPLLGPILAQLVTLGVSDRTEGRRVIAEDSYSEVATFPRVGLNFGWKHTTLSLGYGPSITITPIGESDTSVLILHTGTLVASHRWARSTLSVGESLSYGRVDFRAQALAAPGSAPITGPTPGGTPTPVNGGTSGGSTGSGAPSAATNASRAFDRPLTFASSATTLSLTHAVSAQLTLSGALSYFASGAVGEDRTDVYPSSRGPGALGAATYQANRHDAFATTVSTQFASSTNGNNGWLLLANESWRHQFSKGTASSLGSGLSLTRNSQPDGLIYYSVYPNFLAGISSSSSFGRSQLTVGTGLSSAPAIDPVRALVDPHVSANAYVNWSKDRFSSTVSGIGGLSLASGGNNGALNSASGIFSVSYRLGDAVSTEGGVRAAWQSFAGTTSLPLSLGVYVGISVALSTQLAGARR